MFSSLQNVDEGPEARCDEESQAAIQISLGRISQAKTTPKCKYPKAKMNLVCLKNSKEAEVD